MVIAVRAFAPTWYATHQYEREPHCGHIGTESPLQSLGSVPPSLVRIWAIKSKDSNYPDYHWEKSNLWYTSLLFAIRILTWTEEQTKEITQTVAIILLVLPRWWAITISYLRTSSLHSDSLTVLLDAPIAQSHIPKTINSSVKSNLAYIEYFTIAHILLRVLLERVTLWKESVLYQK